MSTKKYRDRASKRVKFTGNRNEKNGLRQTAFSHPHPLVQRKCLAVLLLMFLFSASLVGRILGLSGATVRNYWRAYKTGGVAALQKVQYKGSQGPLVTHSNSIEKTFESAPPHTISEAVARIAAITGIKRSIKSVRSFLKSNGFRYRKVGTIPAKVSPEKQQQFLDKLLQPRLNEATQGMRTVLFMDAAHFVHGAFLGCLWSKVRQFVKAPSGRQRHNVLGALNAITRQIHAYHNETYINSHSICEFLKEVSNAYKGQLLTFVLDNARYQRCKLVTDLALDLGVELLFLPSYSPNLNLIERLWKFIKKKSLNSRYYPTFRDFQAAILSAIESCNREWQSELESLLSLQFQMFSEEKIIAA